MAVDVFDWENLVELDAGIAEERQVHEAALLHPPERCTTLPQSLPQACRRPVHEFLPFPVNRPDHPSVGRHLPGRVRQYVPGLEQRLEVGQNCRPAPGNTAVRFLVSKVFVSEVNPAARKLFIALTVDRQNFCPTFVVSQNGGVDFEAQDAGEVSHFPVKYSLIK